MKITQELLSYVQHNVKKYEDHLLQDGKVDGPAIIEPGQQLNPDFRSPPDVGDYVLPRVIIWDPLQPQQHCFDTGFTCPHYEHGHLNSILTPCKWKDGRSERDLPRQIYCVNGPVLLVSRVYRCTEGHEIAGHDPRILESIPSGDLKFHLGHKLGFTPELCSLVFALASSGQPFHEIELFLAQRYVDNFAERQCRYARHISTYLEKNESQDKDKLQKFPSFEVWRPTPSTDTVHQCFLYIFRENKQFFRQSISEKTAKWMSADHTFKVAANIGCMLPNGSWSTQFDSLYIVMNEIGQVLAYKLTKGTAISKVQDILNNLKRRLDQQKASCDTIFVDDCCKVRSKLQQIFPNVLVKLDLFHAIQRVTSKVPKSKRQYLSSSFINDFKMIFRADADQGEIREMDTPDEQTIMSNLECLTERWKDVHYDNGEAVLNRNVLHEIENLKVHIERGCLSRIFQGGGSTRNENLHKNLKAVIARSRLGCELAEALLATFFYLWNERRGASELPSGCVRPILSYRAALDEQGFEPTAERFGIIPESSDPENASVPNVYDPEVMQSILCEMFVNSSAEYHDTSNDGLSDSELYIIFCQAVNMSVLYNQLCSLCTNPRLSSKLLHLMPCSLLLFSNSTFNTEKVAEHSERLNKNLLGYSLKLATVDYDCPANSIFLSVLSQLKEILASSPTLQKHLVFLGISLADSGDIKIVQELRDLVVNELLSNAGRYKHALLSPEKHFDDEVNKFRECGYFSSK